MKLKKAVGIVLTIFVLVVGYIIISGMIQEKNNENALYSPIKKENKQIILREVEDDEYKERYDDEYEDGSNGGSVVVNNNQVPSNPPVNNPPANVPPTPPKPAPTPVSSAS